MLDLERFPAESRPLVAALLDAQLRLHWQRMTLGSRLLACDLVIAVPLGLCAELPLSHDGTRSRFLGLPLVRADVEQLQVWASTL